jgi:hypothetical protein
MSDVIGKSLLTILITIIGSASLPLTGGVSGLTLIAGIFAIWNIDFDALMGGE